MVNLEQDASSNSQNVKMAFATIKKGSKGDGYFAIFEIGTPFFISTNEFLQHSLYDNQTLSEQEFLELKEKLQPKRCYKKALEYLARREHSSKELYLKLYQKGFSKEIINTQLNNLKDENSLSDKRFATQFIISRQRRNPEGPFMLTQRLVSKGVDSSLAKEVVDIYFEDQENLKTDIEKAINRLKNKDNLKEQLRKKGFTSYQIQQFLE